MAVKSLRGNLEIVFAKVMVLIKILIGHAFGMKKQQNKVTVIHNVV